MEIKGFIRHSYGKRKPAISATMSKSVSPNAIDTILASPSPDSSPDLPEIVVQVVDLKAKGNRFMFSANDGRKKLRAVIQSSISSEVYSGNIQNLGLIRILDYTLNDIPNLSEKYLIVTKCEAVSPALDLEINIVVKEEQEEEDQRASKRAKNENSGIVLTPKQDPPPKSKSPTTIHGQNINAAPARLAMTRRVYPLVSLNPYQGNWTIKVRVTSKGILRSYRNARGEGNLFTLELSDEDGTQIQATLFNEAAKKFFDKFQLGKVYYISNGSLKVANKQFSTVNNDYEMSLNENSVVEEAADEEHFVPPTVFNFTPIDQLGPFVNGKELVDVIGVVQAVSPTMSIRRKSDNESISKRDITIADHSKTTVSISLWNDLATNVGQELLDKSASSPVVAIKSLRVGDYQGLSLSTISRSLIFVDPDTPESKKLREWYECEGKGASMASAGLGMRTNLSKMDMKSVYSDRVQLSHMTTNPSLGEDKPIFFSVNAYVSFIKPDQAMWYRACKTCNKKVTEAIGSGYWCEGCQKSEEECCLRYILVVKVSDESGEAWFSAFSEQAEAVIGCSADELDKLKSQEGGGENNMGMKLREAKWVPHLFRVGVAQREYLGEKKQRITVKLVSPVDFAAESRFLLEEISKSK